MKKEISSSVAHMLALFTIIVWGTTFIASKLLLAYYSPLQIMLMRFLIAYVVLIVLKPRRLKLSLKEEMQCVCLGLFGCTIYFLLENYALTYTLAANVSILIAMAPILTALLAHFFLPNEKLSKNIFIGFFIAMMGVAFVVFNGTVVLKLNPLGDLLSIGAALCWAIYSVLLKKQIGRFDGLLLTRRIMFWGFMTALPVELLRGDAFSLAPLKDGSLLFCILFLGILGSGICYVLWNMAIHRLGTVVTNNYIYINPFSTMVAAVLILKEPISWMGLVGAALIIVGVFTSDHKKKSKDEVTKAKQEERAEVD